MTNLLIGYDSAWTSEKRGAIVGVVREDDGSFLELGPPRTVNFKEAANTISEWQTERRPVATIILLDQPTIVTNDAGQRPVEMLVSSPVGRRQGGMQPANTARVDMFGPEAPVWQFLEQFGGAADPLNPKADTQVFETYPVLAMIALGWELPDKRPTGRLPKYNPERRSSFSIEDWRYVCKRLSEEFAIRQLVRMVPWIDEVSAKHPPHKRDQDGIDACICLLVALYLVEHKDCLMVGNTKTGYIVVPHGDALHRELVERCKETHRRPRLWVRTFRFSAVYR
jgi:predicted RNase H-like nuclease